MKQFFSGIALWLGLLAFMGAGVYEFVSGANMLSVQTSGVSAHVTISNCKSHRGRGNWDTCSAQWAQSDGTQKTVTVEGSRLNYGQTVDVHLRGDHGYVDGSWTWSLIVGILLVCVWPLLWLISRFRRARRASP